MIKNKKHLIPILSLALVVMLGATGVAAAAGVGVTAFASVLYHAVSGGPKTTSTLKAGDTQATTAAGKRTESGEAESADALGETDETKTGATTATTTGTNANGTPIDAAASASLQALGGAAAGSTGIAPGAGGALVVTKPGQPAVDATAAASLKVATSTSGATAGAGTGTSAAAATTQPPVDATAAASLPKPGSTGTGTTTAPATGTPTTQNAQLISKADAQRIAIATIGSTARVEEIELKSDHYPPVYEVKLIYGKAEYMVVIHAVTGAVISVGKDD